MCVCVLCVEGVCVIGTRFYRMDRIMSDNEHGQHGQKSTTMVAMTTMATTMCERTNELMR